MTLAIVFLFAGPMSCAALNENRSTPLHVLGYVLGVSGLFGGVALITVAVAAKHFLFKDAYNDRSYFRRESDVNFAITENDVGGKSWQHKGFAIKVVKEGTTKQRTNNKQRFK